MTKTILNIYNHYILIITNIKYEYETDDENSKFHNNQNPDGQVGKMYSEENFKNIQAFWTRLIND